jgi:general secretion pathway protein K
MRRCQSLKGCAHQSGMALLVVLMVVAVMAAIAVDITTQTRFLMARTSNQIDYNQSYWYGIGAENMAAGLLAQQLKADKNINLSQPWAAYRKSPLLFGVDNYSMQILVNDLNACFNLNQLAENDLKKQKVQVNKYRDLLTLLNLELDLAESLSANVADFFDTNNAVMEQGTESDVYASKKFPYLAANQPMVDISELRAVQGYSQLLYQALTDTAALQADAMPDPIVCALPDQTGLLNLNTIALKNAALIGSFFKKPEKNNLLNTLKDRPLEGWASLDDFQASFSKSELIKKTDLNISTVAGLTSKVFVFHIRVISENTTFILDSVLYYNQEKVQVVKRRFGHQS